MCIRPSMIGGQNSYRASTKIVANPETFHPPNQLEEPLLPDECAQSAVSVDMVIQEKEQQKIEEDQDSRKRKCRFRALIYTVFTLLTFCCSMTLAAHFMDEDQKWYKKNWRDNTAGKIGDGCYNACFIALYAIQIFIWAFTTHTYCRLTSMLKPCPEDSEESDIDSHSNSSKLVKTKTEKLKLAEKMQ